MTTTLVATAAAVLLAALALTGLALVTLVPFLAAVTLAERAGLGTVRWGLVAVVCALVGLGCAAVALRGGLGLPVVALGAAATWAAPLALLLLGGGARGATAGGWAGRRGRHE